MARRTTPTRIQLAEEADRRYEAELAESARVAQAAADAKAKAEADAYYTRDPKTGLSPAQVEASQGVQAAAKAATEAGIPAVVLKTQGGADRVSTPPSEAPEGTMWKWVGSRNLDSVAAGSWQLINTGVKTTTTAPVVTSTPVVTTAPVVTSTPVITQSDIDAAVAKAVAGATAANNAMIAQMKAEAEAAKFATKQKASDKLTALFSAYGLQSLAPFINTRIMADVSEEMLLLELYDRPEYQQRFPGMASLRKKSRTITEKEYMDIEKAMTQTARFFDLPKGFYDGPEDFGKLIGNEVSAKEFQDRLQIGQDLSRTLNPSVKQQLIDFYGVGEGDLTAFVLDADKALSLIQKQAKAAMFVGIGRAAGFELRGITSGQAENIAGTESYAKLSERELAQALGQAGQLRRTQKRLAGIEGQDYSEQEALSAVVEGSPQALLASQQRAQREGARFSARGGVTGSSFRSTASPI